MRTRAFPVGPVFNRPKATRPAKNGPHARRPGLTLLEVVIALAIFLMALVPIMTLISLGGERALDVTQKAQASLLCQSKLDCVKAGVEPMSTSGTMDIGNLTWNYTIESSGTEVDNLYLVKVTARLDRADGKTIEESLAQMVVDPSIRGSTLTDAAAAAAAAAQAASSNSSSSNTTGGM